MKTWIWYAIGAAVGLYVLGRHGADLYVSRGGTANYTTDDFKRDVVPSAVVTAKADQVPTIPSEIDQWTL